MADQRIELEVVLDDGSIKKAFGVIRDEAKKTENETKNTLAGLSNFALISTGINQTTQLLGAFTDKVKELTQGIIGLSLEAEKVRVISSQFTTLTNQAGIATDEFNRAIQASIAGLIDDDEALQIANESIIRLGISAQRLPQIFELSRQAAAAGFGDIKNNVELLTIAIQTGNTRMLRQIGITVDLNKAQQDYARTQGLTITQLTEFQKQFVNANTILDKASKNYQGVDANIRVFSDSIARLKVVSQDSFERFAVAFDKAFGPMVLKAIGDFTRAIELANVQSKEIIMTEKNAADNAEILKKKLQLLNEDLRSARSPTRIDDLNFQIQATEESLKKLQDRFGAVMKDNALKAAADKAKQAQAEIDKANNDALDVAAENRRQRDAQLLQGRLQFNQQELAARQAMLQTNSDMDAVAAERAALYEAQLVQIVQQGEQQRAQIRTQYSDEKGFNQEQRNSLEVEQINAQNAQVLAAEETYKNASLDSFEKFANDQKKRAGDLTGYMKLTLFQGFVSGFASMGQALAKGENAMDAFAKSLLGTIGDIAIQMGTFMILAGLGYSFLPGFQAGAGAIPAGIALTILGGFLKGLSGGGGTAGAGGAGGGGATAQPTTAEAGSTFSPATPIEAQRVQPNTIVNFTVQGDILDSDSTQSRIVALLNDAIDTKGAVVRGLA